MLRTLALVVAGLAAGFAIATLWPNGAPLPAARFDDAPDARRLADLELALLEERDRRAALERRIDDLGAALAALTGSPSGPPATADDEPAPQRAERAAAAAAEAVADEPPAAQRFARGRFPATPEQRVEQLVSGGFTPQRAQWLMDRAEQLRMDALQTLYDARREGRPIDQSSVADEQSLLRTEIGDSEYEQYLNALGRPTAVGVSDVFASSPAEAAGLRSGDQIVSYAGTRVFDMRDLNRLTYEGQPGQPVVVEVLRDGQQMQLVLPRGPVGITAGRFGGRR
jgi:hypothetical protein